MTSVGKQNNISVNKLNMCKDLTNSQVTDYDRCG